MKFLNLILVWGFIVGPVLLASGIGVCLTQPSFIWLGTILIIVGFVLFILRCALSLVNIQ